MKNGACAAFEKRDWALSVTPSSAHIFRFPGEQGRGFSGKSQCGVKIYMRSRF
jgi:hypothetical protein